MPSSQEISSLIKQAAELVREQSKRTNPYVNVTEIEKKAKDNGGREDRSTQKDS